MYFLLPPFIQLFYSLSSYLINDVWLSHMQLNMHLVDYSPKELANIAQDRAFKVSKWSSLKKKPRSFWGERERERKIEIKKEIKKKGEKRQEICGFRHLNNVDVAQVYGFELESDVPSKLAEAFATIFASEVRGSVIQDHFFSPFSVFNILFSLHLN